MRTLPESIQKKLPRHPVPVARLGRLAVDISCRGKGWGAILLVDALNRVKKISTQIGIYAVIVDAKDETAVSFYQKYGFLLFPEDRFKLMLPIHAIP